MKNLKPIGRIIYGLPFIVFGIMHFINSDKMGGYIPIPGGVFWVYFTGIAMILAAISIVINKATKLSTLLLAILLFIFIISIHIPALLNPEMGMSAMGGFLKDICLMGAALYICGQTANDNV